MMLAPDTEQEQDLLSLAVQQLDHLTSSVGSGIAQLSSLASMALQASPGEADTDPSLTDVEIMRQVTHTLLLSTADDSISTFLAMHAPWGLACSVLTSHIAMLRAETDGLESLVVTAAALRAQTAAWTSALAERQRKIDTLESAYKSMRKARKALYQARADADSDDSDNNDSNCDDTNAAHDDGITNVDYNDDATNVDSNGGVTNAQNVRQAQRACSAYVLARDAAAHSLHTAAMAYYPETLVQQRKRLTPRGLPAIVSQRTRGDYEAVMPLTRGSASRHVLLRAVFDGVDCVLKQVPVVEAASLVHEADILKQLQHPNIVALVAVFVEDSLAYLHMAHASQGDLEQFLAAEATNAAIATAATVVSIASDTDTVLSISTPAMLPTSTPVLPTRAPVLPTSASVLAPRQLQRLARQLCEAVAYLTERSIVHCDIKPANVFVDGNRDEDSLHAVLGDFDVSHTVTGRTTTLTRALSGVATHYTPGYAPPEVLFAPVDQPPRASPAIDVYGLGCVIYAMHMYPRTIPQPASLNDTVGGNDDCFGSLAAAAACGGSIPAVTAWARTVPRNVVQRATCADPSARATARELLHTRYMLDASGSYAHVAIQRPAYWLHQTHSGSWLVDETQEVCAVVEKLLNGTAQPSTHGTGRDSHKTAFQRFKVRRVQRLEHPAAWSAYAAQRRHLADTLAAEGYTLPPGIRPMKTDRHGFVYPLEGGSLDTAAGEVLLFHGSTKPESIANSGFDVRYAFAGAGAGAMFGRGVYFAESASKADQYIGRDGPVVPLTMVVARVLLGRTMKVTAARSREPFLPMVPGKSTVAVPVYYDSIVADMRSQGRRFREVAVGHSSHAYPELFVEYERV